MAAPRGTSYTTDEDEHLCRIYVDISQDPVKSNNQSKFEFWSHIMQEYNTTKPNSVTEERNIRSLQSRMSNIITAIGKLRGFIRQVENLNPSGASDNDILIRAKKMYLDDPKSKERFKYDHVWSIMKDLEKFAAHDGDRSSHQETPVVSSPDLSFTINLSDDNTNVATSGSSTSKSKRAPGAKTTKKKRAHDESIATRAKDLASKSTGLKEAFQQKTSALERHTDMKTMMVDLSTITDPLRRAFFQAEQQRIMTKRFGEQYNQSVNNPEPSFNNQDPSFYNPDPSVNNPNAFGTTNESPNHPEKFSDLLQGIGPSGGDLSNYYQL